MGVHSVHHQPLAMTARTLLLLAIITGCLALAPRGGEAQQTPTASTPQPAAPAAPATTPAPPSPAAPPAAQAAPPPQPLPDDIKGPIRRLASMWDQAEKSPRRMK